jgi:hypothetical protein
MTFFKRAAFALALAALWVSPAVAQEQENPSTPGQIPDPGTYQGSTVLQQQSDQQDQQFRQEQQQPAYQQPMQSYSGGQQQGGSTAGLYPGPLCIQRLAASPQFAPLARKMSLFGGDPRAIQLFGIASRPTATEKALIMRWAEGRAHCSAVWHSSDPRPTPAQLTADSRWGHPALLSLVRQLLAGQLTYGQFNYRRAMNELASERYMAANR